jgi:uncharacterized protein YdaU (DUF1376 family)
MTTKRPESTQRPPAFQFYPADYLSDAEVQLLSLEEEGAYLRALCYCWREGSIPADPEKLARLIGKGCTTECSQAIARLFQGHPTRPDHLTHPRLDRERTKQEKFRKKMSESGKKGASTRWRSENPGWPGHGQAKAKPMASDGSSSSSSSSNNPPNPLTPSRVAAAPPPVPGAAGIPVSEQPGTRVSRSPEERASARALVEAAFPNLRRQA